MALTAFQRDVCRLLADNRIRSGESYVAGGAALNEILRAPRVSRDLDLFHDTAEALEAAWRADRASLEGNRNLLLRIRDRERKLISKIDEALGRIDDGSYGKCEECGQDIGIERLRARPVTTLCIECKSLQEAQERKLRTT